MIAQPSAQTVVSGHVITKASGRFPGRRSTLDDGLGVAWGGLAGDVGVAWGGLWFRFGAPLGPWTPRPSRARARSVAPHPRWRSFVALETPRFFPPSLPAPPIALDAVPPRRASRSPSRVATSHPSRGSDAPRDGPLHPSEISLWGLGGGSGTFGVRHIVVASWTSPSRMPDFCPVAVKRLKRAREALPLGRLRKPSLAQHRKDGAELPAVSPMAESAPVNCSPATPGTCAHGRTSIR